MLLVLGLHLLVCFSVFGLFVADWLGFLFTCGILVTGFCYLFGLLCLFVVLLLFVGFVIYFVGWA